MTTTRHRSTTCPVCLKELDSSTGLKQGTVPEFDDVSFCAYCATLLRFEPDLTLRRWTEAEWAALSMLERVELTRLHRRITVTELSVCDWRFERAQ
jgi:hypothetical protein